LHQPRLESLLSNDSDKSDDNREEKGQIGKNHVDHENVNVNRTIKAVLFKEKIKKFETSSSRENSEIGAKVVAAEAIISSSSSSSVNVDRHTEYQCISENNNKNNTKRIYDDDDKNSNFSTFLINRDERQQQQLKATAAQRGEAQKFIAKNEKCKLKYVNDSNNNNQVQSELLRNSQKCAISLLMRQHVTHINKSDDLKTTQDIIQNFNETQNLPNYNDCNFIDYPSLPASRPFSASFVSDDPNYHLRKLRIPKNYKKLIKSEVRTCANHIYSYDRSQCNFDDNCCSIGSCGLRDNRTDRYRHLLSKDEQKKKSLHQSYLIVSADQTIANNLVSLSC
jgi:hypothetical protein